ETAEDLLLLEQNPLARFHIVVVDSQRRLHRRVFETNRRRVKFQIGSEIRPVGGLVEFEVVIAGTGPWNNPDLQQPALPLLNDQMPLENFEVAEQDVFAVRENLLPMLPARVIGGGRNQAEVLCLIVGPDQKAIFKVVQ